MTLVDTSAWIEFFRGRNPYAELVDTLLADNQVAICGPISTELLRGFRNPSVRKKVWSLFSTCRQLTQPDDLWEDAGNLGFLLKRKGKTIKTMDLLIAVFASAHGVPLLTRDKEFLQISKVGVPINVLCF